MGHVLIGQVEIDRLGIELPSQAGHFQQALQLAGEQQPLGLDPIDQRLFAQAVAGQEQLPPDGVPKREGEHSVEPLQAVGSFVLVKVDDGLGVALRAEAMAGGLQPPPQIAVVVDFAVEDDLDRAVFVAHRLAAAGQVDDRQPAMAQGDAGDAGQPRAEMEAAEVESFVVRAAVTENRDHSPERGFVERGRPAVPDRPGDPAHSGDFDLIAKLAAAGHSHRGMLRLLLV